MNWDGTLYKPTVAWRTLIRESVLVSQETPTTPAVYQATVDPLDITNPGAKIAEKAVNDNILDYIGNIYRITGINVGGNSKRVEVSDDFRTGQSPMNGMNAVVYRTTGGGVAPWLISTFGTHLSKTAMNAASGIDNAILWKMSDRVEIVGTDHPILIDYQTNYRIPYGDNPVVRLFQQVDVDHYIERTEKAERIFVGGLLDSIDFGLLGESITGYILISR